MQECLLFWSFRFSQSSVLRYPTAGKTIPSLPQSSLCSSRHSPAHTAEVLGHVCLFVGCLLHSRRVTRSGTLNLNTIKAFLFHSLFCFKPSSLSSSDMEVSKSTVSKGKCLRKGQIPYVAKSLGASTHHTR